LRKPTGQGEGSREELGGNRLEEQKAKFQEKFTPCPRDEFLEIIL